MGQKTHPNGFRLVTNQKHLVSWYTSKRKYGKLSQEDNFIRTSVKQKLDDFLTISSIEILRKPLSIKENETSLVIVKALYPREKEIIKKTIKYLANLNIPNPLTDLKIKENLSQFFQYYLKRFLKEKSINLVKNFFQKTGKIYSIRFNFIKNQFQDAMLIGKFISRHIENRTPFRRILKQVIKKIKVLNIEGIKIELSGRLNGIEIARSEWRREGKIPLHTLSTSIDYIHYTAKTIYGIIGIKVWLFKNLLIE